MAEMNSHKIPASVRAYVESVVGQMCSRRQIGKDRSLNIGFGEVVLHKSARVGEVVLHKSARVEAEHGTWEIGTYYRSWRIIHGQRIVCGSQDAVDHIDELRQKMNGIEWGHCSAIRQLTDLDVRMEFGQRGICGFPSDDQRRR